MESKFFYFGLPNLGLRTSNFRLEDFYQVSKDKEGGSSERSSY